MEMYFASTRPGSEGPLDIWISNRASLESPWETPFRLPAAINSPWTDADPRISTDGLELYFRRGDTPDDLVDATNDIWVARRDIPNGPWRDAVKLPPPINSDVADAEPDLSPDGLELYFDSPRDGGVRWSPIIGPPASHSKIEVESSSAAGFLSLSGALSLRLGHVLIDIPWRSTT